MSTNGEPVLRKEDATKKGSSKLSQRKEVADANTDDKTSEKMKASPSRSHSFLDSIQSVSSSTSVNDPSDNGQTRSDNLISSLSSSPSVNDDDKTPSDTIPSLSSIQSVNDPSDDEKNQVLPDDAQYSHKTVACKYVDELNLGARPKVADDGLSKERSLVSSNSNGESFSPGESLQPTSNEPSASASSRPATPVSSLERTSPKFPSIAYHNVTGISSDKIFKEFCSEQFRTDIIAVCETFFSENKKDRVYSRDYEGFFCDRADGSNRGGCAIWLRRNVCSNCRVEIGNDEPDRPLKFEALCVTFLYKKSNTRFAVLLVYNPPGSKTEGRSALNTAVVRKMLDRKGVDVPKRNCIVMGDFNRSTLGTERQLKVKFYDYTGGISKLDQVYGTHAKPFPYTVRLRDPTNYNTNHKVDSKTMHKIIELY